jgi:hypothetical protein
MRFIFGAYGNLRSCALLFLSGPSDTALTDEA